MKLILKIIAAPVVIVLTPIIWICAGALYISSWVFGLAGVVVGILGVASLLLVSWQNGVILLVTAFLVSPYGIPMLAVRILGGLQSITLSLRSFIRS